MSNAHYFVGLPVPTTEQLFFEGLQHSLELEVYYRRVTHPEDLHCTLSFIGELSTEELRQLTLALSHVQSEAIPMRTTEIAGFGEGKIPRVVYAAVELTDPLKALEQEVWGSTSSFGADRKTPYVPHITLAKRARQVEEIRFTGDAKASWVADEFCLYRVNKGMRPSYEPIARFPLKGTSSR